MNPKEAYRFCLKCKGKLNSQEKNSLICSNCGFVFYINPSPCNAVIIENEKGEIMLVKRKFDPQKGFWDFPGGFIEPYETLEESVKREINEELGVDIKINKIVGVYKDTYLFQNITYPVISIVVSGKIIDGKIRVSDDISDFKFFPKEEVLDQQIAFDSIKQGLSDYLKNI